MEAASSVTACRRLPSRYQAQSLEGAVLIHQEAPVGRQPSAPGPTETDMPSRQA